MKLRKEKNKTYKEIAHELRISPREISKILKEDNGEKEAKERKKIVLSKTTLALQHFKRGKNPIDVAIKLDLSLKDVNSLYNDYLSSNNLNHLVETFKEFDNDSLQDYITYCRSMKEQGIGKKEIVEAIKKINDYPKIKDEYDAVSDKVKELKSQGDFYIQDNKLYIRKNCELNNENNSLVLKNEAEKRILKATANELNKIRDLLENIKNSKDYADLNNKAKEQINKFLNQKKELFEIAIRLILDTIKADPEKDILINNILYPSENPNSAYFLLAYEEKIAKIAEALYNLSVELNTNNILNS